jgi:hypothetical protein
MWRKKFPKKPLASALFEISCGFKGGKDLCRAGLKKNRILSYLIKEYPKKHLGDEIETHRFFS